MRTPPTSPSTATLNCPDGTRTPFSSTCDGRRSTDTPGLSTQTPVFSVASRTARLSVLPSAETTSASNSPPAALPLALVRRRGAMAPGGGGGAVDARMGPRARGGDIGAEVPLAQKMGPEPRQAANPHPAEKV